MEVTDEAYVWASIFGFDSVYSCPWSVHLLKRKSAAKLATLYPIKLINRQENQPAILPIIDARRLYYVAQTAKRPLIERPNDRPNVGHIEQA